MGPPVAALPFPGEPSYSAAVKTACALVGDTTGPVRAPLLALDDDATFELRGLLDRAGASMATALKH